MTDSTAAMFSDIVQNRIEAEGTARDTFRVEALGT